jgi:hypothetical protein
VPKSPFSPKFSYNNTINFQLFKVYLHKKNKMPSHKTIQRIKFAAITLITIILGLMSRKYQLLLPDFVNLFLGDSLWAMMIFFIAGVLFPTAKIQELAIYSLLFCYFIETSQLYHATWIDAIRHTRIGGLILGFGFLWSDILAYTVGIGVASFIGLFIAKNVQKQQ